MVKQIKIISLTFRYFKGLQEVTLQPDGQDTNIYGPNAAGKTTLFDGFYWLLFNKDSREKGKPEKWIKTLESNGEPMHDVVDAYIIAKIGEAVYRIRNGEKTLDDFHLEYQREVIWSIIDPVGYKEYEKTKKKKSKSTKRRGKPAAADSHTQLTEQPFLF